MNEGKIEEVQKSLPYLESQYPNHPFVLFIKASTETDGDISLEMYQDLADNHTNTYAGELSSLKVAEYLYSKGLYTQTTEKLKVFPQIYPDSDNSEKVFHLLSKSFSAIGEDDSITYYQGVFVKQYSNKNFVDFDYYKSLTSVKEDEPIIIENKTTDKEIVEPIIIEDEPKLGEKPWVVQVGAFGERKNADIIVNRLESAGYEVEVIERADRVNLYLVQVVRFETIEKAINIGEKIQDQLGFDFRILERN